MKYFFPDSSDYVDPSFNFVTEQRASTRVRQRDDRYAHEVLSESPYDGVLVSKAIVDGSVSGTAKFTVAQRLRFYREGVRKFMRLDSSKSSHLLAMGDCGAFTYAKEAVPPYTPDEVIDFYEDGKFDFGISPDHVILGFDPEAENTLPGIDIVSEDWKFRQKITIEMASKFFSRHKQRCSRFEAIGAVQGWSPSSYAESVVALQKIGYRYIAIGGVVPLKTKEILLILSAVNDVLGSDTKLHLLGVTRPEFMKEFANLGVISFDSTAPLQRAFKDAKVNYYASPEPFTAVRVPQVDGNPKLQKNIRAGRIDQSLAIQLERKCLEALRKYDAGHENIDAVLGVLSEYSNLHDPIDRTKEYRKTLEAQAWKECGCRVCSDLGIDIILFRGAERNRRRGFHNLHAFRQSVLAAALESC